MNPIIERIPVSGGWRVSDIIDNHLVSRRYYGYTKREALQEFREDVREIRKAAFREHH